MACLGSPAHAGIDRISLYSALCSDGFPRTRGDRPDTPDPDCQLDEVPPHTRG